MWGNSVRSATNSLRQRALGDGVDDGFTSLLRSSESSMPETGGAELISAFVMTTTLGVGGGSHMASTHFVHLRAPPLRAGPVCAPERLIGTLSLRINCGSPRTRIPGLPPRPP